MSAVAAAPVPRETVVDEVLAEIPVDLVDIGTNVRVDVGDLAELKASIAELGLLEPIVVTRQPGGRYRLVVGQRRLTACRELEREAILAIVKPASDVDEPGVRRSIEQLAENLIRKDLNAVEEAVALRAVLDADPELTQAEVARRLGVSAPWISNTLALLETPAAVRDLIRDGKLTSSHAKALRGLGPKTAISLAEKAAGDGASAHELERMVQAHKRDEEWRKDRAAKSAARTKGLVDKLAARKVALDTSIRISSYGEDVSSTVEALKKAGYTAVTTSGSHGFQRDGCSCTALMVSVSSWSDPRIEPICTVKAHADAANAKRDAKWKAEHKVETEGRAAVKARLVEELEVIAAGSMLARVLLWSSLNWNSKEWAKRNGATAKKPDVWATIAALPIDKVRAELADRIADRFRDIDTKIPWEQILDELVGAVPEPAPKAKPGGA